MSCQSAMRSTLPRHVMVRLDRTIILYVVLLATARCVDADGPARPDHDGESWTCIYVKADWY
jgi:hypothetical protein